MVEECLFAPAFVARIKAECSYTNKGELQQVYDLIHGRMKMVVKNDGTIPPSGISICVAENDLDKRDKRTQEKAAILALGALSYLVVPEDVEVEVLLLSSNKTGYFCEIAHQCGVQIIEAPEKRVYQTGFEAARGAIICCTDIHSMPNPLWVTAAKEYLDQNISGAGVFGKVIHYGTSIPRLVTGKIVNRWKNIFLPAPIIPQRQNVCYRREEALQGIKQHPQVFGSRGEADWISAVGNGANLGYYAGDEMNVYTNASC